MAKPSMFTKAGNKPYKLPVGENYYIQVPKWQAEQIIMQNMNRGGFDVATMAAQRQAEAFYEDYRDSLIQGQLDHYKQTKERAKKLSEKLKNGSQIINHPIEYALNKSKKKIANDYEISDAFGGLENKTIVAKYAGITALETAADIVLSRANVAWDRYCTLQEDYMSQQVVSNVQDTISRVKGLSSSLASGVVTGFATAGVGGAIVGGLSSVFLYANSQYQEHQQKMSNYYQQLNAANSQMEFAGSKLGLINNGRGTEN